MVRNNGGFPSWYEKLLQQIPVKTEVELGKEDPVNEDDEVNEKNSKLQTDKTIINQFKKDELQKRQFKKILLNTVCVFVGVQTVFMNGVVIFAIISFICKPNFWMFRSLNTEEMHILVSFIEFYISSTIVELLGMLFFIVKNVFDKTLKDMFENNSRK